MAELNLKQITDKLNSQLKGDVRKLVFWYDENGEFAEDIDTLELSNAKVLHLEKDNQFFIKHFLECEDTTTHYLVYAPFPKPDIKENHLEDTLRYSKRFYADRASLITLDLGFDEKLKDVFQEYKKFFAGNKHRQKFYDLEIEATTKADIEIGIMSVICKLKTSNFEEVVRAILTEDGFDDNKYLAEFERYGVDKAFWEQANEHFGYSDPKPTLEKFTMTLFVTYLSKTVYGELPQPWKSFVAYKSTNNVTVYLDNLMNSYLYGKRFDEISDIVYNALNADKVLRKMEPADIVDCHLFAGIDRILIDWLIERLENEDTAAKLNGKSITEICINRRRNHFGNKVSAEYYVIENAWHLLSYGVYVPVSGVQNIVRKYQEELYEADRRYRYFYFHYDKVEDTRKFENLRQLVENVYTNDYLNNICVNWNRELKAADGDTRLTKQINFFDRYIRYAKERTVVIISDALRYEVGYSLFRKLKSDEKCKVKIEPMQSVLPSYTRLGMAALLPHRTLELTDDFEVLVDGKGCNDTAHREPILQSYKQNSRCVQYDDLKNMNQTQLREVFTNQDVVYVYHNQIDARGDKLNTENEVFTACEEAIEEISALIRRLTTCANTVHFIVTADHGFIYKRDNLTESDKIGNITGSKVYKAKRYVVAKKAVEADGVESLPLADILQNDDDKIVSFPMASDIFKAQGGGINFVHGGSSPQEMLIPLIDVRTEKGHKETTSAVISLVSLSNKITNLIFSLDFIQNEPVGSVVKETTYRICFVNENGEKISNEIIHTADNKSTEAANRIFKLRFNLRNRPYNRSDKYYLLIVDDKKDLEVLRQEVMIDIAFADDFGF
ncbi:BREX-1 system phosphatase PglZ type A [Lachnoclostridium sp. MSJ-17]|uniref:BREX-1 system phosphatase PglZ type A n=1 Tax=Lachnoclostridium sp. MSJ-17 TaxID=2841516 RepID=UPI001C1133DA|nr:BREX-1 system phosphatase PglZ type A [Lachnoclostridium sp. MSJ-17]MBU5461564.1 BREX-1 system phosphatase PglZ type A [Lachnoclostridium sp. MSJ-17]